MPVLTQNYEYLLLDRSGLSLVRRKFSIYLVTMARKQSVCMSRPHGSMADSRCEETDI